MTPIKKTPSSPKPAVPAAPPTAAKASTHAQEVDDELRLIYDPQTDAAKTDMTRLEQVSHSLAKNILVGLMVFFAVLAAISWAGFFFFSPAKDKFKGENVNVTIEGPVEVKSGELVTYAVRWKNGEGVPLGTSQLEIRLPKAFSVAKTEPAADDAAKSTWQIGSIGPGKDGLITVQGVYLAPLDKEMDIQAILTYRPADFNSEFQKVSTRTVKIKDSVLELEVKAPSKILPGDKVAVTLAYRNASQNAFKDLRLRAVWPDNFIPDSSNPASTDDAMKEWTVKDLPADGTGAIMVNGTFASAAEGRFEMKGLIGFLDNDEQFQLQRETAFETTVLKGDLVTALMLNGKAGNQPIRFGDALRYNVTYKNTGTVTLEDVSLTVSFETGPAGAKVLLWNNLKDKAKGVRKDDSITWNKRQVPSLAKIGAGEEGSLDFELPVLSEPVAESKDANYQVISTLLADVARIDGDEVSRSAKSQPITAKIMSDAELAAQARYFNAEGIPVGTGPLPPVVGKDTTCRIVWKLNNSLHELTDLKISAKLPPGITWTGLSSVDAGDIKFDAGNSKMVWTLNWMPTTIKTLTVSFDVKLTPTDDQRGTIPLLLDSTIFEAIDKLTGDSMLLSKGPLTMALDGDDLAAGKGRVQ